MLQSIFGKLIAKTENFVVVETNNLGFKIFISKRTFKSLPQVGTEVKFFTHLHWREEGPELYGFLNQEELSFFETLNLVPGVGPRSALAIMGVADLKELSTAIEKSRPDLLIQASGIGRKTAERITLELKNKILETGSERTIQKMESDTDIIETLINLGYPRTQVREVLEKIDEKIISLEGRLKAALKILSGKK